MIYTVVMTPTAIQSLKSLKKHGRGTLEQLQRVVLGLANDPKGKTTELREELAAFRSLHVGRFRIIVKIVDREVRVYVITIGWHESGDRDDIYQLVSRLVARGKIELKSSDN